MTGGNMHPLQAVARVTLVCVVSTVPSVAVAGKCSGTNANNLMSWDQTEIAKGTTLATLRSTSITLADEPTGSHHTISGECIGVFLIGQDGKTLANGYCARRDKDGDVLNEEWIATDGAGAKGTWKWMGGTGKFAKANGGGQWEFTPLQGKMSAVRWTGVCQ